MHKNVSENLEKDIEVRIKNDYLEIQRVGDQNNFEGGNDEKGYSEKVDTDGYHK